MCGIAGIVDLACDSGNFIGEMTGAVRHRGPDAQNTFTNRSGDISLGHTRLSIIDLSTAANQPFVSQSGRYVIVFNGEIYNFKSLRRELETKHQVTLKTSSDTEVLVEGFAVLGSQLVTKLEGMFAFTILDQETKKVFLFRDRVGKKPLFYFQSDQHFVFASEIKALLKHPVVANSARIRRQSLSTFLHLGYTPEPHTIYENILKFPAGHFGELGPGQDLRIQRYWTLESHLSNARITDVDTAKDQLKQLLTSAVNDRLVSDVPVGAFLSGGTDSSLVCAIASKLTSEPLKTFSIGFKDGKFDETKFSRDVSRHLNTEHQEFILEERDALEILQTYLHHFDEPFADTSAIPTMLVSKLARQKVKVALTGDGGDELFLGYGAYKWAERLASPLFETVQQPLRSVLRMTGESRAMRAAHLLEQVSESQLRSHIFSQEQYFFSQSEIETLLSASWKPLKTFVYNDTSHSKKHLTSAERQALFDFEYYLKDDLLVKVDRASMYYALECRCPLLDHKVIEFAFRLGSDLKVRNGVSKWILKELLRDYLPHELVYRRKWGFSVPLSQWLKGDLRYMLDDTLSDRSLSEIGIFNLAYVKQLKEEFLKGRDYLYNRLWVVAVLQKWMKEHAAIINI